MFLKGENNDRQFKRIYKTLDVYYICDTRIPDTFEESASKVIERISL